MASRRVTKSAVDWASFYSKVPLKQRESFRALKSQTDKQISKLAELPEALPKIDFEEYRRRVADKGLVAEFEKMYSAFDVPYPKDPSNNIGQIQTEEKTALQEKDVYLAERNLHLKALMDVLQTIDTIPSPERMTMQMYNYYFPEGALNPNLPNPGFADQRIMENQPTEPEFGETYYNHYWDRRNAYTASELEVLGKMIEEKEQEEKEKHKKKRIH